MAGTTATLRTTGVPSGYPAEIESNADFKVRYLDKSVEMLDNTEIPLLKALGGANAFTANNVKMEWMARDIWSDRDLIGGTIAAAGTTLTLSTTIAHRFARGQVLKIGDELLWVSAIASTSTLTVVRGYAGTSDVEHLSGVEMRVVGMTEVEGTDFVLRGSALHTLAYNFFSIIKMAQSETWINSVSASYTRNGPEMAQMLADDIKQIWVSIEAQVLEGRRHAGTGVNDPPMSGGLRYFGTSGNGAQVVDCGGAALSKAHFLTAMDAQFNAVGLANMSFDVLCGIGAQRRLWQELVEPFMRATWENGGSATTGKFRQLDTEYGTLSFLGPFQRIPVDEIWIVNRAAIKVGTYEKFGPLHEGDLATQGDYTKKFLFGMYGNQVRRIPSIVRIHNFALS